MINTENRGVSAARNVGIKNSSGKYLLFVDSDDRINHKALRELKRFIELYGEDTDVFLYSLKYDFGFFHRRKNHWRDKYLKSGLNGIDKDNIVLTNINFCVNARIAKKELFDTNLTLHEDEEFAIRILLFKRNFCFCPGAVYIYNKERSESVTNARLKHPKSIEMALHFYKSLSYKYFQNGTLDRYVQKVIFNDFTWRVKLGCLMRDGEFYNEDRIVVSNIINQISNDVITTNPNINESQKLKFLAMKNKVSL